MILPTLIAKIESNGDKFAMRFEPAVFRKQFPQELTNSAVHGNKCSKPTAQVILSTSWGMFQIMGFNLYGFLGVTYQVGKFIESESLQIACFRKFCDVNDVWIDGDVPDNSMWLANFAKRYNGPGNVVEYVRRMRKIAFPLKSA